MGRQPAGQEDQHSPHAQPSWGELCPYEHLLTLGQALGIWSSLRLSP